MNFYRVKQVSKTEFIPQVKRFLGPWEAIDRDGRCCWFSDKYQKEWCAVQTLGDAKNIVSQYKNQLKTKKEYPKYYKI